LYEKLKRKYPYYHIPRSIEKNILNKIMTFDNEFYERRRRQLKFFLNYLYNHEDLMHTKEFFKFMNDPEFDSQYFDTNDNIYSYPEAEKCSETLTSKFFGMFMAKEVPIAQSDEEALIKSMEGHYLKLYEDFNKIRKSFVK
jgi:hypothetical protein